MVSLFPRSLSLGADARPRFLGQLQGARNGCPKRMLSCLHKSALMAMVGVQCGPRKVCPLHTHQASDCQCNGSREELQPQLHIS